MAELSGYGGGLRFDWASRSDIGGHGSDATHNVYSWSAEVSCDALEVTGFANGGQRTYIRGLRGWTAAAETYVDDTYILHASDAGVTGRLYLYCVSNPLNVSDQSVSDLYYYGDAILTGISPSVAVDSVVTQSLSFTGMSDLVYSDAS